MAMGCGGTVSNVQRIAISHKLGILTYTSIDPRPGVSVHNHERDQIRVDRMQDARLEILYGREYP